MPGGVVFSNQADVDNFQASLNGCKAIGGDITIIGDSITNLNELSVLTSIGGSLYISDNEALTGLAPLQSLNSIMGNLGITGNDALTNLTGLENVNFNSITNLNISDNSSLFICKSKSLCNYLVNPAGDIVISGNATGCNSEEEVEVACVLSVESIVPGRQYSLFPNPAGKTVNISTGIGVNIDEIVIYNQTGQKVLHGKPVNDIFDISQLSHGMYIIEVVSGKWKEREKLIVQ